MKITKALLRNLIKEALEDRINPDDDDLEQAGFRPVPDEMRQAATGTEDEVRAEIDEILTDAGMTPMDALVVLAQQGVIDIVLDLGMFLKE